MIRRIGYNQDEEDEEDREDEDEEDEEVRAARQRALLFLADLEIKHKKGDAQ